MTRPGHCSGIRVGHGVLVRPAGIGNPPPERRIPLLLHSAHTYAAAVNTTRSTMSPLLDESLPPGGAEPAVTHVTTVEHRGSFAHATCGCAWRGPGRRAVSTARDDAEAHQLLG